LATSNVAIIAEGVHQSVWSSLGVKGGKLPGQTGGITGMVYASVRGVTKLVGKSIDMALKALQPALAASMDAPVESRERQAVLAALNGVMGDTLVAYANPLATPMSLRYRGEAISAKAMPAKAQAKGKIVLMLHGLCMNDLQWNAELNNTSHDHGAFIAQSLGYTPVYVRYNTGLHTSQNGRELCEQLAQLVAHWPVRIDHISIVAHSMGGLVARSALHIAQSEGMPWLAHIKHLVCLGTPHHGAPLEQAGNGIDLLLSSTPFSAPFKRLAQLRSAGITDLRYGFVADEHWHGKDRFRRTPDHRMPVPLPQGVACYAIAASTAAQRSALADRLIGDGMVPLHSALGKHEDDALTVGFDKEAQYIAYRTNHMQLLSSAEVAHQIKLFMSK
jgi:pimeloyl-ACP methyl ester carboxylesterase